MESNKELFDFYKKMIEEYKDLMMKESSDFIRNEIKSFKRLNETQKKILYAKMKDIEEFHSMQLRDVCDLGLLLMHDIEINKSVAFTNTLHDISKGTRSPLEEADLEIKYIESIQKEKVELEEIVKENVKSNKW